MITLNDHALGLAGWVGEHAPTRLQPPCRLFGWDQKDYVRVCRLPCHPVRRRAPRVAPAGADAGGPELDTRLVLNRHLGDPQNQRRELGRRHGGAHAREPEGDVLDDLAHARGTPLVGRERRGLFSAAVWHGGNLEIHSVHGGGGRPVSRGGARRVGFRGPYRTTAHTACAPRGLVRPHGKARGIPRHVSGCGTR